MNRQGENKGVASKLLSIRHDFKKIDTVKSIRKVHPG